MPAVAHWDMHTQCVSNKNDIASSTSFFLKSGLWYQCQAPSGSNGGAGKDSQSVTVAKDVKTHVKFFAILETVKKQTTNANCFKP